MTHHLSKKPPVVRLPPKSNVELLLSKSAEMAMIVAGVVAAVVALDRGKFLVAPVVAAIIVGLMLGPVATRIERHGVPAGLSAGAVVLLFLAIVSAFLLAVATPLAEWAPRIPQIWNELQIQLAQFREPVETLRSVRDQLRSLVGSDGLSVSVEGSSPVASVAALAPAVVGQALLFLASLYFFVATRNDIRVAILRVCVSRKLRWRVAHIFRDVEASVSRYLLSISLINVGLGCAVALAMWAIGMPAPALWGALAGLLNYIIYLGPAVMAVILFAVGLTEFDTLTGSLLPPLAYLGLNFVEAQFVTPHVIGRTMLLNPFLVILALAFWLWLWGPLGGLVAIPLLLIVFAVASNILPGMEWDVPPDGR